MVLLMSRPARALWIEIEGIGDLSVLDSVEAREGLVD